MSEEETKFVIVLKDKRYFINEEQYRSVMGASGDTWELRDGIVLNLADILEVAESDEYFNRLLDGKLKPETPSHLFSNSQTPRERMIESLKYQIEEAKRDKKPFLGKEQLLKGLLKTAPR